MKSISTILFGSVAVFVITLADAATSRAAIILSDNFDYPDGSLVPNGGWANHSGTAGDLMVVGGQAVVQHGTPSEDANRSFTAVAGDIFFGLDFTVTAANPISGTDNEYFAHFKDAGFNFAARLDVVPAAGGGDFSVGIASDDSVADATWATALTFGTTYRAVVRYDQVGNRAELWIDPTLQTDTSILGDDKADPGDTITQFALRQSDSDLNETVRVDGLVVGTSFSDVVSAVPEPSSAFAMLLLSGAMLGRRRRHRLS